MNDEFKKLLNEDISKKDDCEFCNEVSFNIGEKTKYGAVIIFKIGDSAENGWFATLSPRTGSNPEKDFTIQLMPFAHITHFSQVNLYPELAENYGIAFSKLCEAMTQVMAQEPDFKAVSDTRESGKSIATYGKCTTWKDKKEHLHVKIFPFRGDLGQPSVVDSSFGRKEIFKDIETGEEYVRMKPVRKKKIKEERFNHLSNLLISLLK